MPYRKISFVNNYFYHVFNRGVEKRDIFTSDVDRSRFLKTLLYYQLEGPRPKFSKFNPDIHKNLKTSKIVDIISYCLMPNHFHLLLRQVKNKGISEFLSKVINSYTKYLNTKYQRVGHLFQGAFKVVQVTSDEQLIHLSRYIHLNPFVSGLTKDPTIYQWSSYQEFLGIKDENTIEKQEILNFFISTDDYKNFILDHQDYAKTLYLIKHQLLEDVLDRS